MSSMTKKILSIALLILLFQIPNIMVDGVISSREARHNDAVFSIQDNWARRQTVVGPFLTIPCTRYDGDKLVSCSLHVLPENLQVDSDLKTEIRYRGIYEAVVGIGDLQLQGSFVISNVSNFDLEEIFWKKAVLALGVEDVRGISELDINYNGNTCSTVSGLGTIDVFSAGAHCPVILTEGGAGDMDFAVQLVLRSSGGISFIPVGRTTTVSTRSDWSSPKFDGAYLPAERVISDDGFEAEWKVLHLNRSYPQMWLDGEHNLISSQFGVEWLVETNVHKQSSRTMHYSILFILFTFIAFFAAEIANRKRLHPMQYLLTGFAIIIFLFVVTRICRVYRIRLGLPAISDCGYRFDYRLFACNLSYSSFYWHRLWHSGDTVWVSVHIDEAGGLCIIDGSDWSLCSAIADDVFLTQD